ncbi:MAG: elongation factor P maturation arginine rhamnosyltransferase EarP [Burkholderiales bacterium]|nr:elongation factor P maturation arginine rhamnosyltransferase EarP [Burkholderiales bacterium]
MRWDIFCRVIDNHGDLGVCWRLAADLAARGEPVRLWVDDPLALAWMAPHGAQGVSVVRWVDPLPAFEPGEVVIEAFGCDPPAAFVARMAAQASPPLWINLEYLSAEAWGDRCHGLPSPQQQGPGKGLTKWFYYPGFSPECGGLLREAHALDAGDAGWLAAQGAPLRPGERRVSLFAYANAPLEALFERLDDQPTLVLLAAGAAQAPALALFDAEGQRGRHLHAHALPWLDQPGYDQLLRACDLNFARGEDSIVRTMWAGAPFVWQVYAQADGAHAGKLDALLERLTDGSASALAAGLRQLWRAWNGLGEWPPCWPDAAAWRVLCLDWRHRLAAQSDLTSQILRFVCARR